MVWSKTAPKEKVQNFYKAYILKRNPGDKDDVEETDEKGVTFHFFK